MKIKTTTLKQIINEELDATFKELHEIQEAAEMLSPSDHLGFKEMTSYVDDNLDYLLEFPDDVLRTHFENEAEEKGIKLSPDAIESLMAYVWWHQK